MKYSFFLFIAIVIICCTKHNQNDNLNFPHSFTSYKYYNGSKQMLGEMSNNYIIIGIDSIYTDVEIKKFISNQSFLDAKYNYKIYSEARYKFKEIPVKFSKYKTDKEIEQIIILLNQNNIISYVHYAMQTNNCKDLIGETMGELCVNSYGSSFYVKVNDENNLQDLNKMIKKTQTELVEQNKFMPQWFELRATKYSKADALNIANYFYESGLFLCSEPSITKYAVE